jgi:sorbose reductase
MVPDKGLRMSVNIASLFELRGKKALVTGASSGIGKQVAMAYAQAGAAVAIAARHREPLQELAAEIVAGGGTAIPIACDVTQPESVSAMLNRVNDEIGGIDIAVCNAGIIAANSLLDMPLEDFQTIQNTNVNGVFLTAQAAAKAMVAQHLGGTIITTASMSGHIVNDPQQVGHYCASKAAVIHLTKAMAVEFAPHNIRVNSVSPGYILTELIEPLSEYHASWEPKIPLGRLGRPEELVGIYVYLASDASSYMTGSDVVIDGGYTCW